MNCKLPTSWSNLTWQQLCDCWQVKMRYGGDADVARVAALLTLCGCSVCCDTTVTNSPVTGERLYRLRDKAGRSWTVTPREAAYLAKSTLLWFDYPYGDPGEKEVTDEKGGIIKPRREPVFGYVSQMHDALILPIEKISTTGLQRGWRRSFGFLFHQRVFALPQVACNNLTWQQYRSLQTIAPMLFDEGCDDGQVLSLQAQFLAHCLVPRSIALLDTAGGSIRLRLHYEYRYDAGQADGLVRYWEKMLKSENRRLRKARCRTFHAPLSTLFHICFQTYQTALTYYATTYPLLFNNNSKQDTMRDALQGEVGTVNTIMKYAGYAEQQQVYDSNLPFVLDILNTMAKEAKEIEKMNAKIKKK